MREPALLDRVLDGQDVPDDALSPEVARLTDLARALGDAAPAPVRMRDEARTALRMQLIQEAGARREAPPSLLRRTRERLAASLERLAYSARAAGAGGLAAVVLSGGGVAVAAGASLPGDLLYDVKLGVEEMRLSLSDEGTARGQAHLARADGRIAEAARALARGAHDPGAIALRHADGSARAGAQEHFAAYLEAGDTGVLTDLGRWVLATNEALDGLPPATGPAASALADLRTTMNRIGQRVEVLTTGACTTCDPGVHDDPSADPDVARGTEADGTPPLPSSAIDLTVIPPADEPFRACPCVTAPLRSGPAAQDATAPDPAAQDPTVAPSPSTAPDPPPSQPRPTDPPTRPPGGGAGLPPLPDVPAPDPPDPGPVTDPLRDPVREAVEDVLEQLPADGGG